MKSKPLAYMLAKGCGLAMLIMVLCQSCAYAGDLEKALKRDQDVMIKGATFDENIDLIALLDFKEVSPGKMVATIPSNVVFIDCMFKDFKAFQYIDDVMYQVHFGGNLIFMNCTFNGDVDLSYATIEQDFSCARSVFAGKVVLSNVWCKGRSAQFTSAIFHQAVKFTNAVIENKASFLNTEFGAKVSFQKSIFKGPLFMGSVTFKKYAGFDRVFFHSGATFDKSVFKYRTSFAWAYFAGIASFIETEYVDEVSFEHTLFIGHTDFGGAQFTTSCDISNAGFLLEKPMELVTN
ncbi:MAG: pentapeptide repeat-containing protein [Marinilabiliaceae bacterium]|nr:pentapeptide repeat-containing protein [Marinilabiliaceae bacterium]